MNIQKNKPIIFELDTIAGVLFALFYAMPFVKWGVKNVMELIGLQNEGIVILLLVMYLTVFLLCILNSKYIVPDFFILLGAIILFFLVTYYIHPEYNYVYTREKYGVLPYVLRPDNGIYAYLFVRMLSEPEKLNKSLRISSFLMLAFSLLVLIFSLRRGYWIGEDARGQSIHLSYDLNFGYNLLLPVCTFMLSGLKEKKIQDLVLAAIGIIMIFIGGSRGPLIGIMIFGVLYFLMTTFESKHKIRNLLLVALLGGLFFVFYRAIFTFIGSALEVLGISSRTITKLLEGSISDDNGRWLIWLTAQKHILANPLGSGAMGARNALYHIHIVGHPHNIFLELLIDYGVIIGPIVILVMIIGSFRILFAKKYKDWRWVYLLFFAQACSLIISYTYWHSNGIWGALAVAVCAYRASKRAEVDIRVV